MQWFFLCLFLIELTKIFGQINESFCITPIGELGECIPIYDCKLLLDAIHNQIYHDFIRQSECGRENSKPLVCCGNTLPSMGDESEDEENIDMETSMPEISSVPPRGDSKCGRQDGKNKSNSSVTELAEFPWIVLIQYQTLGYYHSFACGGTLISERYVLTAAHCIVGLVDNSTIYLHQVRLGEWNTSSDEDCTENSGCAPPPVDIEIEEAIPHPKFNENSTSRFHDIALLRLISPVTFSSGPICLPKPQIQQAPIGTRLALAGWGRNEFNISNEVKMRYMVFSMELSACEKIFNSTEISLRSDQICAMGGKDSCRGDSGDPLMYRLLEDNDAVWYIEGIASLGAKCGPSPLPGLYTSVSANMPWIMANIRP